MSDLGDGGLLGGTGPGGGATLAGAAPVGAGGGRRLLGSLLAPLRRGRRVRTFREGNLVATGLVAGAVLLAATLLALNFSRLPVLSGTTTYRALFANAGGLTAGDIVTVAGVRVGSVTGLSLRGDQVEVRFTVANSVRIGSQSSAGMKVLTPIGQEYLEITPAGPGTLHGPIPEARTTIPLTLVGDLSTLSNETARLNLAQLERSLDVTSTTLRGVPKASVSSALTGLARLSTIIASRQQDLSTLVTSAASISGVLARHSADLVNLVGQGDLVLRVLEQRRAAITALLATTSSLGRQLTSLFDGSAGQLTSLLANLDTVSRTLADDRGDLATAIPLLQAFSRYAANATGSGPFADFTLPTLLIPDNVIAQCAKERLTDPLRGCRV
jgi:phospholipid/cholesterol/gamma-HCH transport system substrate-binding protein